VISYHLTYMISYTEEKIELIHTNAEVANNISQDYNKLDNLSTADFGRLFNQQLDFKELGMSVSKQSLHMSSWMTDKTKELERTQTVVDRVKKTKKLNKDTSKC
jgi:hypothetical protein